MNRSGIQQKGSRPARESLPPAILTILDKSGLISKTERKNLNAFVRRYANEGKTLDIGSNRSPYAQYFPNRVGLDVRMMPGVDIVGDAHDLHMIRDEEFDCILCTEVLEHLHTPERAISEIRRILKKGGTLILTTRFVYPIHSVKDYYRYTKCGLMHLLRDFEILEFRNETDTIGTLAVLFQRIGLQCETLYFKPFRLLWLLLAKITPLFSFVITKEHSEVANKNEIDNFMTTGYYVACRK